MRLARVLDECARNADEMLKMKRTTSRNQKPSNPKSSFQAPHGNTQLTTPPLRPTNHNLTNQQPQHLLPIVHISSQSFCTQQHTNDSHTSIPASNLTRKPYARPSQRVQLHATPWLQEPQSRHAACGCRRAKSLGSCSVSKGTPVEFDRAGGLAATPLQYNTTASSRHHLIPFLYQGALS